VLGGRVPAASSADFTSIGMRASIRSTSSFFVTPSS
jgi:hypothetical protein